MIACRARQREPRPRCASVRIPEHLMAVLAGRVDLLARRRTAPACPSHRSRPGPASTSPGTLARTSSSRRDSCRSATESPRGATRRPAPTTGRPACATGRSCINRRLAASLTTSAWRRTSAQSSSVTGARSFIPLSSMTRRHRVPHHVYRGIDHAVHDLPDRRDGTERGVRRRRLLGSRRRAAGVAETPPPARRRRPRGNGESASCHGR